MDIIGTFICDNCGTVNKYEIDNNDYFIDLVGIIHLKNIRLICEQCGCDITEGGTN